MNKRILLISFMLTCIIISGCMTLTYISRDNDDVQKFVYESWTKDAYLRAQERLKDVYIGMPTDKFDDVVQLQAVVKGKKVVDVIADGLLRPLGGKVKDGDSYVTEFVFGYVLRGLAVQKTVVQVRDDKVYRIIDLEAEDLGPIDMREVEIKGPEYFNSKEGYLDTKEKLKNVEIGMNKRVALIKLGCSLVEISIKDGFFLMASGYLRNLYSQQEIGDDVIEEYYFGYVEDEKEHLGFIVRVINNKVSEIVLEESKS